MNIRDETGTDVERIGEVTETAFASMEISSHTEHYIVEALRRAGALVISLVAELEGRIVGHIAFSPVEMSDGTAGWYGLGPVSVVPEHQKQGIGAALIEAGLSRLKEMGAQGCCLVGHPAYYGRFGFRNVDGLGVEGVPSGAFFALGFDGRTPRGQVRFHDAFRAEGPGA